MMDAHSINSTTDLVSLVPGLERRGRYFIGPCPFCGGEDRFNIKRTDDGDLWICRGCGDGRYHDAVAFRMLAEGRTFREVIGAGDAATGAGGDHARRATPQPTPRHAIITEPPTESWQLARLQEQKRLADGLWAPDVADEAASITAQNVRDYLVRVRGLSTETSLRFMLGFNRVPCNAPDGVRYPRGIYIPCMIDGILWSVKVRLPPERQAPAGQDHKATPKYLMLQGSVPGLFNADALLRARVAVVVEGEFDALLLGQFLPPDWAAVTMGGAMLLPDATFLPYFSGLERVLLCLDNDAAGEMGRAAWQRLFAMAESLPPLPEGAKDMTEFWRKGGDVKAWIDRFAGEK